MTDSPASNESVARSIASLRIVAFALAAGLALFLIVASFLAPVGDDGLRRQAPLFTGVAFVLGALHVVGYVLVRRAVVARVSQLPRSGEPEARQVWLQGYHATVLVGSALAEGAGMVATVFYLLTGSPASTVITFLAILAIALLFPSETKFEAFVLQNARR